MYLRTVTWTWAQALQDAFLAALTAAPAAALLLNPRLHVIKNQAAAIGDDYDLADLATDEADFTGYAVVTPSFNASPINGPNYIRYKHAQCDYRRSAMGAQQIGYWVLLTNAVPDAIYGWELLAVPVPFELEGDDLSYDLTLSFAKLAAGA